MQGKIKGLLMTAICIIILISVMAAVVPLIVSSTTEVTDCTTMPSMVKTMFEFAKWVPATLLMVGVLMTAIGVNSYRKRRRGR